MQPDLHPITTLLNLFIGLIIENLATSVINPTITNRVPDQAEIEHIPRFEV